MKKINIVLAALLGLIMFSCQEEDKLQVSPQEDMVAPVLKTVLPDILVLDEHTQMNNPIGALYWTSAEYGLDKVPSKYTVEIDTIGNKFAKAVTLSTLNGYELTTGITAKMLNNFAKGFFEKAGSYPFTVEMRIRATLPDERVVKPLYSNIINFSFTAFVAELPTKDPLYIVGELISGIPSWKNDPKELGDGLQVCFADDSKADNKKYTYTGLMNGGKNFKLPTKPGDWNKAYAWSGGKLSGDNVGDNIPSPGTDGYYTMTIDLNKLTVEYAPYAEGAAAKRWPTIGVIGNATPTGWDSDTDMTEVTPHIWVIKEIALVPGEIKFRANNDWVDDWGKKEDSLPYGIGAPKGGNIVIEKAGTYLVQFNDLTNHYVIILKDKLN